MAVERAFGHSHSNFPNVETTVRPDTLRRCRTRTLCFWGSRRRNPLMPIPLAEIAPNATPQRSRCQEHVRCSEVETLKRNQHSHWPRTLLFMLGATVNVTPLLAFPATVTTTGPVVAPRDLLLDLRGDPIGCRSCFTIEQPTPIKTHSRSLAIYSF